MMASTTVHFRAGVSTPRWRVVNVAATPGPRGERTVADERLVHG